jgi:hypothetical protein
MAGVYSGSQYIEHAGIAQLVERNLAKVDVAGSSPVSRFFLCPLTHGGVPKNDERKKSTGSVRADIADTI